MFVGDFWLLSRCVLEKFENKCSEFVVINPPLSPSDAESTGTGLLDMGWDVLPKLR